MTRAEVYQSLASAGLLNGFAPTLNDNLYDGTSGSFVRSAWSAWVQSLPIALQVSRDIGGGKTEMWPRWVPEVFDCDSHVQSFGAFLGLCFAADAIATGKPRGNPACGFLSFSPDDKNNERHAISWFVDYEGKVQLFDPGSGKERVLSDKEKVSANEITSI
tara:strand:- start:1268 stop:1750 length:483 start_codon:yes stop_codon:yes gene_type:complete